MANLREAVELYFEDAPSGDFAVVSEAGGGEGFTVPKRLGSAEIIPVLEAHALA